MFLGSEKAVDAKSSIDSFLLSEIHAELCERDEGRVDDRTKFVYDKARELYWTISRLTHGLRESLAERFERRKPAPRRLSTPSDIAPPRRTHRLLIDVTPTYRRDIGTGIQRVVREMARAMVMSGDGLPTFIDGDELHSYFEHPSLPQKIDIGEGDIFLMLDAGWANVAEYRPIMDAVSRRGGVNIACVYDLLPLLHPAAFTLGMQRAFRAWFEDIVLASDAVVAISDSVAREFRDYAASYDRSAKVGQRVGWWRLGADFGRQDETPPTPRVAALCTAPTPFFLTVGTLAPTKGNSLALSAFDEIWSSGLDARYVIVGKRSWNTRALERRIEEHPEFGRRLFWLNDAQDSELRELYRHARSLVYASVAEGFGLPLVEAAHHGAPVIASDIPAFREIGGEALAYFDPLDRRGLAQRIAEALEHRPPPPRLEVLSWSRSARSLASLIRDGAYQYGPVER